ncbi:MAG: 16S rRNA (uracil(1498)-N(3))-methyltransferase, partial [Actinomycetota bacterium]|nr:16S rRNA (uracil(1498)-N(3))-methyltransferase [Actinomycetota bacterium]
MSNPVYFCASLDGEQVVLDGPEGRHAATVRRTRVGEVIDLVDGRGTRCTGSVTAATKDTVTMVVDSRVLEEPPSPWITLVQALAKGERGELAVELATEVGVDEVVPWAASRCVVRWDGERGGKALERWRSTAREAAKQARRAWFPVVRDAVATAEIPLLSGTLLVLHEGADTQLSSVDVVGDVVLVVGPEGGISDEELEVLGGTAVRLGGSV